jgi:hypothetical protein
MNKNAPLHAPSLKTMVDFGIACALDELNVAIPAVIDSYDANENKAVVHITVNRVFTDGTVLDLPSISGVPVVWPGCKDGSMTFPLSSGDGVLLVFSQRSLDEYLTTGNESVPSDSRLFDISDAIAIPGLFPYKQVPTPVDNENFQISFKNQTIKIKTDGEVEIGGALATKLVTDAFMTTFNTHTHSGGTISGATGIPNALMTDAELTSKVKAQ